MESKIYLQFIKAFINSRLFSLTNINEKLNNAATVSHLIHLQIKFIYNLQKVFENGNLFTIYKCFYFLFILMLFNKYEPEIEFMLDSI